MLDRGESPCPAGYRVPNVREAVLMSNYITDNPAWWRDGNTGRLAFVGGYYSFGKLGKGYDPGVSWYFQDGLVTAGAAPNPTPSYIRCVRDVR